MKTHKNIRISKEIDESLNLLKYQLMIEKKLFISKKELVEMLISKRLQQLLNYSK